MQNTASLFCLFCHKFLPHSHNTFSHSPIPHKTHNISDFANFEPVLQYRNFHTLKSIQIRSYDTEK